jgi:hypothetical protein
MFDQKKPGQPEKTGTALDFQPEKTGTALDFQPEENRDNPGFSSPK